jgi:hypothetical protein
LTGVCPDTITGKRDRALILLGFGGAFRRSEETPEGLRLHIPRSKTDQDGEGVTIAVSRGSSEACPVRALREWLDMAGIEAGPIFGLSIRAVWFLPID